jgi:tetratricopeptide (TPR) repeat protein
MAEKGGYDQRDQKVSGNQTNINEANAPVFAGDVGVVNVFPHEKPPISRPPFIPDPPSNFTGRYEELKELQAQFDAGKTIIALHGFGGVGKTALSLKLVESIKDRYPDGQIMVDMRGTTNPISPMEAMGSVIRSYHREEKIPDSEAETRQRYLEVLKDKRALMLLDNALDDKQVLRLVPPKGCCLIITSRKAITIPGPFFFKMDLNVLKPGETLELLLNVCCPADGPQKSTREDPAWPEIAQLCGFLPLALLAAASYLANSEDVSPREYAKALADERSRLEIIGEQGVDMSVEASLGLSFQWLEPKLQQTFLDLSAFPADFDSQAEELICLDQGHKSLSELVRWSLVDYKAQGQDYGRYKLHDLARIFATARLREDKKEVISERHARYFRDKLFAANELYMKGGSGIRAGLALYDREKANIMSGQAWAASQIEEAKEIRGENNAGVFRLCRDYIDSSLHILDLRLNLMRMISWLETGLKAARALKDRQAEGTNLVSLARTYNYLSKPLEAIDCSNQALTIAHELGDINLNGDALASLGNAHAAQGTPREAIKYYEQALAVAREIGDQRDEVVRLGNLGNAYAALGEFLNAINSYDPALKTAREIGDKRNEGAILGFTGWVCAKLGDANKAKDYHEQALAIAQEIGDIRKQGMHMSNLGSAYIDLGNAEKAIEYLNQALKIAQESGDTRGEGAALSNLGSAYAALNNGSKAVEYCEEALEIARKMGDKKREATALWKLSLAHNQLNQRAQAIKYAESALKIREDDKDPQADKIRRILQDWQC